VGKQEILTQLAALVAAKRMMSQGWVDSAELITLGQRQHGQRHPRPGAREMSPEAMRLVEHQLGEIHPSSLSFDRSPEVIRLAWQSQLGEVALQQQQQTDAWRTVQTDGWGHAMMPSIHPKSPRVRQ
jgi:hypothetical protein